MPAATYYPSLLLDYLVFHATVAVTGSPEAACGEANFFACAARAPPSPPPSLHMTAPRPRVTHEHGDDV
jgi:hypothetical protein